MAQKLLDIKQKAIAMKKIVIFLIFAQFLFSCNTDENNDTNVNLRTKLVDYWEVNEQSQYFKRKSFYTAEIFKDENDSTKIHIDNFYNQGYGVSAYAFVNDNYTINLPSQNLEGFIISGTGKISTNLKTISWEYIANDGEGLIDSVKATYSRE
ncbi:TPA: hypothetical protein EYP45_04085 [Candidatus Peregrinibacteria bacterium]|nr:hypothetical protein [Candidatus Peregrinibacteria bacterium]